MEILEIAATWSFWDRPLPTSVPRQVDLPDALSDSLCLVVQGVRRSGKSTLLQQIVTHYDLNLEHCVFLNFEDPRLAGVLTYEVLDAVVEQFRRRHPSAAQLYFFLDEIQGVTGWERWVRSQLDRKQGHAFVVTGSNATMLSGELSTVLTGRHLTVELFPFSWEERTAREPTLSLESFLHAGGFPEPLTMTPADGDRLRRQYFDDIVERDIRERLRARSSRPIRQVAQMVYEAAGSELSLRRVASATGIATDTASNYLDACEAAYLLFGVPFFAYSERKRASRNRKYYPVDTGLRRVVVTKTGRDVGKALECATFLALRRRYREVFYWRGEGEVDFVVLDDGHAVPYQVTWDGPEDRHDRALGAFYEHFPHASEAVLVTGESFGDVFGDGRG